MLRLVDRFLLDSLSCARALTLYASTYATDGRIVKRIKKMERQATAFVKRKKERMMCRAHSHVHMYRQERRKSIFYPIRSSRSLSLSVSYARLFWHFFVVFLSFSCVRRYWSHKVFLPITSLFSCFVLFSLLPCVRACVMREERAG